MSDDKVCARCGMSGGYLLDLDTGSVCHPMPGDCLARLASALTEALAENARLREQVAGHEAFARSVNEALNSGDGAYRP